MTYLHEAVIYEAIYLFHSYTHSLDCEKHCDF